MNSRIASILGCIAVIAATPAIAQQPAPPAPNFAPSNTSAKGVQSMAAGCAMCHGTQGRVASGSALPGLAGKAKDEIVQAMAAFKSGQKAATIMHQIAKGYSETEVAAIAEYFASQSR